MSDRAIAQQGQEKFQFYLLSLVFTLLGLSVQTAKLGISAWADTLEIMGWSLLLASGFAGMWFMEMNPALRVKYAQKREHEEYGYEMHKLQLKGETTIYVLETASEQKIADIIASRKAAVDILGNVIEKIEKHQAIRYHVFRYCFAVGVFFVVVSRSLAAFGV